MTSSCWNCNSVTDSSVVTSNGDTEDIPNPTTSTYYYENKTEVDKVLQHMNKNEVMDWDTVFPSSFPPVPMLITNMAPPPKKYGEMVEFTGYGLDTDPYDAQILCDVMYTGRNAGSSMGRNQPIFVGISIDPKHFYKKLKQVSGGKHILFFIHGFSIQPEKIIYEMMVGAPSTVTKYRIIPLLWETPKVSTQLSPVKGFLYKMSRHLWAPGAGRDFAKLVEILVSTATSNESSKSTHNHNKHNLKMSIACHSQGNYVLRIIATKLHDHNLKLFQNVFMVAADETRDFFSIAMNPGDAATMVDKTEDEGCKLCFFYNWNNETKMNPGHYVAGLVKNKVFVLWKQRDEALESRKIVMMNWFGVETEPLGTEADWYQESQGRIHPDLEPIVQFQEIRTHDSQEEDIEHNYEWFPQAIAFYESQANKDG